MRQQTSIYIKRYVPLNEQYALKYTKNILKTTVIILFACYSALSKSLNPNSQFYPAQRPFSSSYKYYETDLKIALLSCSHDTWLKYYKCNYFHFTKLLATLEQLFNSVVKLI